MKGITLPEIIIAIALTALIGGLIGSTLVNSSGVFYRESSKVGQGVGVNNALADIRNNIKEASAVAAGYPVAAPTYYSETNTIVLQLKTLNSSGNIVLNAYDYVVYYVDHQNLTVRIFPNAQSHLKSVNKILSGNVSSLVFQYLDINGNSVAPTSAVRVRTILTLRQKAGKAYETNIATSEANLRND